MEFNGILLTFTNSMNENLRTASTTFHQNSFILIRRTRPRTDRKIATNMQLEPERDRKGEQQLIPKFFPNLRAHTHTQTILLCVFLFLELPGRPISFVFTRKIDTRVLLHVFSIFFSLFVCSQVPLDDFRAERSGETGKQPALAPPSMGVQHN